MLIAIGSMWSDEFSLSQSQLHSQSPISFQDSDPAPTKAIHPNSRNASNPFDILYDKKRETDENPKRLTKSPSYIQIEQEIFSGSPTRATGVSRAHNDTSRADNGHYLSAPPPTVTVINDGSLRRGGLGISPQVSIRRRTGNSIRLRNKMVHREDLKDDSMSVFSVVSSKKKKRRRNGLSFVFPIKRRTSFKYTPVSTSAKKHSFETQRGVDEYFMINNIAAIMRDMLPRKLKTFEFKGLTKVDPVLHSKIEHFAISRAANFTMVPDQIQLSAPVPALQGTKVSMQTKRLSMAQLEKTPSATLSEKERRQMFISTVTKEYRNKVFAGNYKVPPRLHQVLPFEADILTPEENVAIDTKLALEVLLRRTLAAKIDYRLKRSGYSRASFSSSRGETSGTSGSDGRSASSSSSSNRPEQYQNRMKEKRRQDRRSKPSSGFSSINTTDFLKDMAPSEALPSPQISFALSFGSKLFENDLEESPGLLSKDSTVNRSGALVAPPKLAPANGSDITQTPKTHITSSSVYSADKSSGGSSDPKPSKLTKAPVIDTLSPVIPSPAFSEKFAIDLNNFFFDAEKRKQDMNYEKNLSNLNLYSLRPMNRSIATLSSSGDINVVDKFNSDNSDSSHFGKQTENEQLSFISSYHRSKRGSRSTTRTSIIHSLDNLANSVNEYLVNNGGLHYITVTSNEDTPQISPEKLTSSSIYSGSFDASTRDLYGAQNSIDLKSANTRGAVQPNDRAQNFNQHYSLENILQNLQREKQYESDLLGLTYASTSKSMVQNRSTSKEHHSMGGSIHDGYTETSISTNSPSSVYSSIAPLSTVRNNEKTKSDMTIQ